jgi:hypothetical protein
LLGEWRSNDRGELVAGWPKLSGGKTRAAALSNSKAGKTWQWQHRRGFPFLYLNRNATVIPTDWGRD